MSDKTRKTFAKIRTFAGDMERMRKKHKEFSETKTKDKTLVDKKLDNKEVQIETASQKPAAGKHTTRHSVEKIPAFHELKTENKELKINQKTDKQKNEKEDKKPVKKAGKKTKASQTNLGYGATVITDTKKNKIKFFPSVILAVKKWFKKITKPKKKKVPKYTIPETVHRKGVIQKATSKTGSIFTADNETIKEQIRKRHLLEQNKEKIEKRKDEDGDKSETSWSPYTETGFNLLQEPDENSDITQNIKVEFKKKSFANSESKEITPAQPKADKEEEKQEHGEQKKKDGKEEKQKDEDTLESKNKKEEAKEEKEPVSDPNPTPAENEKDDKLDTNTLTIVILTLVVSAVLLLFSGQLSLRISDSKDVSTPSVERILKTSSFKTVTLSSKTLESLPQLIKSEINSTEDGLSEIAITSITGTEVGAAYLMSILGFNTLPALNKAITDIRFVTTDMSKNIVLLQFTDKTTVLGGLLHWEASLANDMQNMFSLPSTNGTFKDKTLGDISFRELVDVDTNKTILVYGIIGEETVVITTNEEALVEIAQAEFSN